MSTKLNPEHENLLRQIAEKEGLTDFEIVVNPGSVKGDNYLGEIALVQITDKTTKKTLDLVLKAAQQNEKMREVTPVREFYKREVFLYEEIFETFMDLGRKFYVEVKFDTAPKCYGSLLADKNECLVLENLRENGFSLCDRKKTMAPDHVEAVFKEYAKYHAYSYVYKQLKPAEYSSILGKLNNIYVEHMMKLGHLEPLHKNTFQNLLDVVKDEPELFEKTQKFASESREFFQSFGVPNKLWVISHGDNWCNNIMFKYEDPSNKEKPTAVKLIDFQLSSAANPTIDLIYFFYVCCSKEILDDWSTYLKIYYENLSEVFQQFGIPVYTVMTYDELLDQWKFYAKYGAFIAALLLKVMLGSTDDAANVSKNAEDGKNIGEAIVESNVKSPEYVKRLKDVVSSLIENEFL